MIRNKITKKLLLSLFSDDADDPGAFMSGAAAISTRLSPRTPEVRTRPNEARENNIEDPIAFSRPGRGEDS